MRKADKIPNAVGKHAKNARLPTFNTECGVVFERNVY
jgi:hypothetical protein